MTTETEIETELDPSEPPAFKRFFDAFGSLPLAFKTYVVGNLCDVETLYQHFRDRLCNETETPRVLGLAGVLDELVARVTDLEKQVADMRADRLPFVLDEIPNFKSKVLSAAENLALEAAEKPLGEMKATPLTSRTKSA